MLKVLELFGGIGACSKALERLGIDYEIADYVEIDKYAVKSFNAIHNTNFEPQDIRTWDKDIKVDLIMHGSPCQDFSLAGKQAGGDIGSGTRSSLMYETIRIVGKLRPKYVIWENVKNLLSTKHKHNFEAYLETMKSLGYTNYYKVLNAKDYGIPQNRERVFTVSILGTTNYISKDLPSNYNLLDMPSFEFPPKQPLQLKLKDMLEEQVDEKYYLTENQIKNFIINNNGNCNPSGKGMNGKVHSGNISPTITTNKGEGPKINMLGLLDIKGNECIRRVYSSEGVSPTLTDMQGGNRQPKVVVDKPRKDIKELDRHCEYCGNKLERKRFNGRLEDFTVFSNRKYCNRECMKRDFLKVGDNHNQTYSNAHTTARKINELILHKEVCELCGSDRNLDIHHIDGNWQNNNLDNLMCLCRSCHTKYERNKDKEVACQ